MKKKTVIIIIIVCILTALNIYNALAVNPKQLKIDTITLKDDKITDELNGKTILYFSDLCYDGKLVGTEKVEQLITTINSVAADVIIFGGDLGKADDYLLEALKRIENRNGLFFVAGKEDQEAEIAALSATGFIRLDENIRRLYFGKNDYLLLSGGATVNTDNTHLYIQIAHEPDDFALGGNSDYVLAGHSLGGQVYLPLINLFYRPQGAKKYYHGRYENDGRVLYISNGVGVKEKTIRFWADGEIKLFRLAASH